MFWHLKRRSQVARRLSDRAAAKTIHRYALLIMAVSAACAVPDRQPAAAEPATTPNPNRTVSINYVYPSNLGFGSYSLSGLTVNVYSLPLSTTFPLAGESGWALKVSAPIQVGIYQFRATDTDGTKISLDQQSLALVPGAELQIPLGDRIVVKPFASGGVGHAFGVKSGVADAYIYSAGARAVTGFDLGAYRLTLGSALLVAGDTPIGPGKSETYSAVQAGIEIRRPLGFAIGPLRPDLGLYAAYYYYPKPLEFTRFLENPLRVSNQGEVGFSIGSAKPFEMLWFQNPRIGLGYVFGNGLTVYHVNFGFPF
jgi:hypothetical protein